MSEPTFYLHNGRVRTDCPHELVEAVDSSGVMCRQCGGTTEHPGDTSGDWVSPPPGTRVRVTADICRPESRGKIGTTATLTSGRISDTAFWIEFDDGSVMFAMWLVTWIEVLQP